jgi:uncharacterized protein
LKELKMRVLIPGGTGLIGRALAQELITAGHQVFVLSRRPQAVRPIEGVTVAQWDGTTAAGWGHMVNEMDVVVNLAGENIGAQRWTARRIREIYDSRKNAGRAVVEAVAQAEQRPQVVLQASAIGYYGKSGEEILTEDHPPGDGMLAQICTIWEASTRAVEELGVRQVVTRTGLVISEKGGFMDPVLLQYRLFGGGPLGGGKQWWSWIHLRDVVRAMRFLLESSTASGPYNLTAPNPVRMDTFGRAVGKVLRRPHYFPIPAFSLKLVLGEMSELVLEGQHVLPKRLQGEGFQFTFNQVVSALRDTFD